MRACSVVPLLLISNLLFLKPANFNGRQRPLLIAAAIVTTDLNMSEKRGTVVLHSDVAKVWRRKQEVIVMVVVKMNLKRKSCFLRLFTCRFRCQFQLHFRPDLLYRNVNNTFLPEQDRILCKMYFLMLINIYDQCKSEMTCINKIGRAFVSRLTNQRRSVSWILKVYIHTNWGNLGEFSGDILQRTFQ